MGDVVANMSMSLDGFVEDRHGSVADVFGWYDSGKVTVAMPGDEREFRMSAASAEALHASVAQTGALVCGRALFDLTKGWDGRHPAGAPVFVVTHQAPQDWPHPDFTFVTDGVAAAITAARAAAGDRTVAVASADIARQCLDLGLLDAIQIDLVPVILGSGKPFFAGVADPVRLSDPVIIEGQGVTHLRYEVRR